MSDQTTADALLADGYREFPPPAFDHYKRLFQKRVTDAAGTLYFVNFREWDHPNGSTKYDADLSCDTATGGTVWITIKEDGIRHTESRAAALWAAAGSVYYERV